MRILPYKSYNFTGFINNHNKHFKNDSISEGQILKNGKIFNRHTSTFFRSDLDWEEFGKYLKKEFSNYGKIQTLIWGCSRGQEAYSMAILLKRYFGEDFKKFFPIEAMDIDSKIIEKDKHEKETGFYLDGDFIEKMKNGLNIPSLRFNLNEIGKYCKLAAYNQYQLKSDISDSVEFSTSNILTDTNKIDSSIPSIIMCRNMWPYIDSDKYYDVAKNLSDRLCKGSIIVIGEYDYQGDAFTRGSSDFPKILVSYGFKPTLSAGVQNSMYIFEK